MKGEQGTYAQGTVTEVTLMYRGQAIGAVGAAHLILGQVAGMAYVG